jgi:hypothetical protein
MSRFVMAQSRQSRRSRHAPAGARSARVARLVVEFTAPIRTPRSRAIRRRRASCRWRPTHRVNNGTCTEVAERLTGWPGQSHARPNHDSKAAGRLQGAAASGRLAAAIATCRCTQGDAEPGALIPVTRCGEPQAATPNGGNTWGTRLAPHPRMNAVRADGASPNRRHPGRWVPT